MKRFIFFVALLILSIIAPRVSYGEVSYFRAFVVGSRTLSDRWNLINVNFAIKSPRSIDIWCFVGPRYNFSGNSVDLFVGHTFPGESDGTYILSPRLSLHHGRLSVWQDLEWYPEIESVYTATMGSCQAAKYFFTGIELETFISRVKTSWHFGPMVSYRVTDRMLLAFTWHYRRFKFGGNFIRLSSTFIF